MGDKIKSRISKGKEINIVLIASVIILGCLLLACQTKDIVSYDIIKTNNIVEKEDDEIQVPTTPTKETLYTSIADGDNSNEPISDTINEGIETVKQLNLSTMETIEYEGSENYFGDRIETYMCGGYLAVYRLLSSDKSLVAFSSKEVDTTIEMELSDNDLKQTAINYVKQIWVAEKIEITKCKLYEIFKDDIIFDIEGTMGGNKRYFSAYLNGKGDLLGIESYPRDIDLEKGFSQDVARDKCYQIIREYTHIKDINKLTLVVESITEKGAPLYIYEFEYRANTPTVSEFDYDCSVQIIVATGKMASCRIIPIVENIDIIQFEDAEKMAKEYIANNTDSKDITKYTTIDAWIGTNNRQIEYNYFFNYDSEYNYNVSMISATGKFMDIGKGPIN